VTREFAIFAGIMCAGVLLTDISVSIAAPNAVPRLNTRPTCESQGRRLLGGGSAEACIRSEKDARKVLTEHWMQYSKVDQTSCVGKVRKGGHPSYIELLSCLEIRQHANEIRQTRLKKK
jgi:hypothetical protein